MYHRITDAISDPWGLCVAPRNFSEHLEVLRKSANSISLKELVSEREQNNSVTVTFDDGYLDNLQNALPLLERYDVPSTVFVVSGYIGGSEFWWDQLDRIFLQPGTLPEKLELCIRENNFVWHLNGCTEYGKEACHLHRFWKAWQPPPTTRHSIYYSVWETLHALESDERKECMGQILKWARFNNQSTAPTVTAGQLVQLGESKLIEIGAHSVTHPSFPKLSSADQEKEIVQSKKEIESVIGKPIRNFAYPHGEYTQSTPSILQRNGFDSACTTQAQPVRPDTDRYQLPRFQVHDWNGEEFSRQLASWLGQTQ